MGSFCFVLKFFALLTFICAPCNFHVALLCAVMAQSSYDQVFLVVVVFLLCILRLFLRFVVFAFCVYRVFCVSFCVLISTESALRLPTAYDNHPIHPSIPSVHPQSLFNHLNRPWIDLPRPPMTSDDYR